MIRVCAIFTVGCALLIVGLNSLTPHAPAPPPPATYASDFQRHAEIGEKKNPSEAEIKEYLLLDARLSVQEGKMTVEEFEAWAHTKY